MNRSGPPSGKSSAGPPIPAEAPATPSGDARARQGRQGSLRATISAGLGAVLGVLPHVLHHVALIGGAALVTGATGNALFFVIGLVFSLPMLRRLYRRYHHWAAPVIALAVFVALFSLSAFVIGPAIAGQSETPSPLPAGPSQAPAVNHSQHHSP